FETASYWAVFILAGFILSPVISWVSDWIFENWSLSEMLSDMFDTPARRIFAIAVMIITLLLTVSAYSQNVTVVPVKPRVAMILPPVEYDHYYEGDLTIKMVATIEELRALCRIDDALMLACSWHNAKSCFIV